MDPQSLNLYVYARNNPLAYVDPTGMERVRLGQHTDDEINKRVTEIDAALKQEGITKAQTQKLQSERNTLLLEQEGNKVGNAFLAALDKIGGRNGLQLSDLTLSTTPATDFQELYTGKNKLTPRQEKELVNGVTDPYTTALVLRLGDGTLISREIFILRPSLAYQGTLGGGLDYQGKIGLVTPADLAIFGGTNLRHEQYHRDVGPSETRAYSLQLRVLNQFGPGAFANKQFYNYLREGFGKATRTGAP